MNSRDRVLTVHDYYDGPRLGVTELNGVPHIYEAEFDYGADEYAATYFLSPIAEELLALVLEDWQIWLRWEKENKAGRAAPETHPALPSDRAKHEQLLALIGDRLKTDPQSRKRYKATFSWSGPGPMSSSYGVWVQWVPQ
jgi:hypothetical protein